MKIDHIGIAVESLQEGLKFYRDALGLEYKGQEEVKEQGVKVAFLKLGESKIELLEPLGEEGPIARHLEKRGPGIHHLALEVSDIDDRVQDLKNSGVEFIGEKPSEGAGDKKIIFIHPKSARGVLLELCEVNL